MRWTLDRWAARPGFYTGDAFTEYLCCFRDARTIHATCEDYRAGATIDIVHDEADRGHRLACPLLVLWGEAGLVAETPRLDPLAIWRARAADVRGRTLICGHFLPEETPDDTYAQLTAFFSA